MIRQLTGAECAIIRDLLTILRSADGHGPCAAARTWLAKGAPIDDPMLVEVEWHMPRLDDFLHWFGVALCRRGAFPWPVIAQSDSLLTPADFDEERADRLEAADGSVDEMESPDFWVTLTWLHAECMYANAELYWPIDALMDAARQLHADCVRDHVDFGGLRQLSECSL